MYGPRRQYKRKDAGPDDEKTRVRITLLEYGNKGLFVPNLATPTGSAGLASTASVLSKRQSSDALLVDDGFNDDDDMSANEVFTLKANTTPSLF